MEGITQIVLCSFFSSQLCASIFHEFPSSCHRIESPEQGGKHQKKQNTRKEQVSGRRKRLSTARRTKEGKL